MTRELQYDLMKRLGIILVLVGHAHIPQSVFTNVYLFHMPLFFWASGCFFKVREGETFGLFVRQKARRLLVPYLVFLALFIACNLLEAVYWPEYGYIGVAVRQKLIQFALGLVVLKRVCRSARCGF